MMNTTATSRDTENTGNIGKRTGKRDPVANRQLLISATLETIAEIGITDATVSSIIKRAGLSRGMIHLHFGGKDHLLTSAAKAFSEDYYTKMKLQLANAGDRPQDIIMSVVRADLSEPILNPYTTRIWHAFRGVSQSHPGIARYSSTQDDQLHKYMADAFDQIAGQYDPKALSVDSKEATFGTLALLEGMWVHYLSDMEGFSRDGASDLIRSFLAGLFPRHF